MINLFVHSGRSPSAIIAEPEPVDGVAVSTTFAFDNLWRRPLPENFYLSLYGKINDKTS